MYFRDIINRLGDVYFFLRSLDCQIMCTEVGRVTEEGAELVLEVCVTCL